jgi:hypothetical protein
MNRRPQAIGQLIQKPIGHPVNKAPIIFTQSHSDEVKKNMLSGLERQITILICKMLTFSLYLDNSRASPELNLRPFKLGRKCCRRPTSFMQRIWQLWQRERERTSVRCPNQSQLNNHSRRLDLMP